MPKNKFLWLWMAKKANNKRTTLKQYRINQVDLKRANIKRSDCTSGMWGEFFRNQRKERKAEKKKSCAFEWCCVIYQSIVGVYGRSGCAWASLNVCEKWERSARTVRMRIGKFVKWEIISAVELENSQYKLIKAPRLLRLRCAVLTWRSFPRGGTLITLSDFPLESDHDSKLIYSFRPLLNNGMMCGRAKVERAPGTWHLIWCRFECGPRCV